VNDWEDYIGRRSVMTAWLDPGQANHLAVTLDRDPSFAEGDLLPPAWHWIYFHDLVRASDLGREGHPRVGIVMPPIHLPRRMWAAGTLAFEAPLVLGSTVERVSTIRSITPKEGRSGPLVFVDVEHEIRTGATRNLLEEQTIVYRDLAGAAGAVDGKPAPADAEVSTEHRLDNATLFRYSALTFNAHRIHYDADYARDVEGYPNVIVHGPLLATLLLDLCVRHDRPLGRFTYRAVSPIFLPQPFTTNGMADGARTRLWATDHEGVLAMKAEAAPG
jgi:3-methylfumaryl-CoA hydratase